MRAFGVNGKVFGLEGSDCGPLTARAPLL